MHDDGFTYFPSILFMYPIVYYLLFNADRLLLLEEPTNYLDEEGVGGSCNIIKKIFILLFYS